LLLWTACRAAQGVRDFFFLPNNQRQHRILHTQEDVLPDALC